MSSFPASPTVDQEYTFNGTTWVWKGSTWDLKYDPDLVAAITAHKNEVDPHPAWKADLASQYASGLFIPARDWNANGVGTPTYGTAPGLRKSGWSFPADVGARIEVSTWWPAGWASVVPEIAWANAGAGSGAVRWTLTSSDMEGADLNVGTLTDGWIVTADSTAGAQWIGIRATLAAQAATGGRFRTLVLTREGNAGADTLANSASFYGLLIRPASA